MGVCMLKKREIGFSAVLFLVVLGGNLVVCAQGNDRLTPLQRKIEQLKQRLSSSGTEERRDALMKLGAIKHPEASRAATLSLNDPEPVVRATAAHAVTSLPPAEAAGLLIPLLKDKLEFVRREIVYALGETKGRSAVQPLVELMSTDKEVSVRAAAAVALGQIGDETAAPALTGVLSRTSPSGKAKKPEDDFVMRAAAMALGQIRSRAGVQALVAVLTDEAGSLDVRRAAAEALGLIGDPGATPALQTALASTDPYLSEAARESLRRLRSAKN